MPRIWHTYANSCFTYMSKHVAHICQESGTHTSKLMVHICQRMWYTYVLEHCNNFFEVY